MSVDELVPASAEDEAWLERLRRDVYQELMTATFGGWDEVRHLRHFKECWERGCISIIKMDGAPVGMIQLFEQPDAVEVGEIQLQQTHQNQGIGSRILKDTIARAAAQGKKVMLSVGLKNDRALQLYERLGFRIITDSDTHHQMVWVKLDHEFHIVPYDPRWPEAFAAEAVKIRDALGPVAVRIDHNGSTSVPGLAAKPIIDIQVSVSVLRPIASYAAPLQTIGYVHVAHADDLFCPFFHRPANWPHTHHVHVVEHGGAEERRTLAFRDYLREHADAARQYEKLKRDIAQQLLPMTAEARERYARAKTEFIERTIATALKCGYPRNV